MEETHGPGIIWSLGRGERRIDRHGTRCGRKPGRRRRSGGTLGQDAKRSRYSGRSSWGAGCAGLHWNRDRSHRSGVGRCSVRDRGVQVGGLNVLVNAAGPVDVGIGPFEDVDDDEWGATFDIGTLSVARCVRAALPLLRRAPWARVVNISAHSTKRQSPGIVAYTAA